MSEYQYYEFLAIDRPLDKRSMSELRQVSTRARITPASFVNTYEWGGGLRADPQVMMQRYFDAHLYVTNWGTVELMLRVPAKTLSAEVAARYCVGDAASVSSTDDHTIIRFVVNDEDGGGEWVDGEGQLAAMVPARAELMRGDLRLLYLGWLMCVQADEVPDGWIEPPLPPNLGQLDGALETFAELMRIDRDLLEEASTRSPKQDDPAASSRDLAAAINVLDPAAKDALLLRVALGDGNSVAAELVAASRERLSIDAPDSDPRSAWELHRQAEKRRMQRELRTRRHRQANLAQREAAARRAHDAWLAELAVNQQQAWRQIDEMIETRKPGHYDAAVALLVGLGEVSRRDGDPVDFGRRLELLRYEHRRKSTLIERLNRVASTV